MMALRHVGIRPLYSLTLIDFKKKIWEEEVTERLWNLRTLNSGCHQVFEGYTLEIYDCIYCPYCDEYFSKEQWYEEGSDVTGDSSEGAGVCEST